MLIPFTTAKPKAPLTPSNLSPKGRHSLEEVRIRQHMSYMLLTHFQYTRSIYCQMPFTGCTPCVAPANTPSVVDGHTQSLRPNLPHGRCTLQVSGSRSEVLRRENRLASASALSALPPVPVLPMAGSSQEMTCDIVTALQRPLCQYYFDLPS